MPSSKRFEEPEEVFRLWDPVEIYDIPAPEWAVEEMILERGTTLLYGSTNVGKSLLALDWALRMATGINWFNQEVPRRYKVAYVYAEGAAGLQLRYRAYVEGFNLGDWEPVMGTNLRFMGLDESIVLTPRKEAPDGVDWDKFIRSLEDWGPDFVIFDPVQEVFRGIDQKADDQVGKVFALRDRIKHELGAGCIFVHHTNKQGKEYRGVTTWMDLADTGFLVEVPNDQHPALIQLSPKKNRFGSKNHKWDLLLKEQLIKDRRLAGETSVYLTGGARSVTATPDDKTEELLAILRESEEELSHTELQERVEWKIDNTLNDLKSGGLVKKGEGHRGKYSAVMESAVPEL